MIFTVKRPDAPADAGQETSQTWRFEVYAWTPPTFVGPAPTSVALSRTTLSAG
ncbi:hypothetical protein ACFQYP_48355 [Nonomuraea antimicrobica]|uniref:hypothetical protein n=1 Tax=Nonomuraea antimicrobica TaxID=561173 RepID=UPI0031E789ED